MRTGWSRSQRRVHWITACLIIMVFPLGFWMVNIPAVELFAKFLLYQAHKTIGILVLALTLSRFWLLYRVGYPPWEPSTPTWQRSAASLAHISLLGLLLIVPILGYLTSATAPAQVPTLFLGVINVLHIVGTNEQWFALLRPLHRAAAIALVTIATVHATAALTHYWRVR